MANIGLSVFEGVANGLSPFVLPSKHNVGLLMGRERGIPFKATQITSLQEDRLLFGGTSASFFGAYVTRNLFKNAGSFGALIYGVRMFDQAFLTTPNNYTANGLFTDGAPSTQALTSTVIVAESASAKSKIHITAANVTEGDVFTISSAGTSGSSSVSYTALASDGVEEVNAALFALLAAQVAIPTLDFTDYVTWSIGASNAYIIAERKLVNVAVLTDVTLSTTNGSAVSIATLYAGQKGSKDPGTWGNSLSVKIYPIGNALGDKINFVFEVKKGVVVVESFKAKTFTKLLATVNQLSNFIMAETTASVSTASITDIQTVSLSSGANGTTITDSALTSSIVSGTNVGYSSLDGAPVNLVANTEFTSKTAAITLNNYVNERADPLGVACYPYLADAASITDFATSLQIDGPSYMSMYNLWVSTSDEDGGYVWNPGIGTVIGAGMIRVPNLNRDLIFTPPAGIESAFRDLVDISPNTLSQKVIDSYVQQDGANVAVFKQGKGFFLFSSRTQATNPLYHSIHIRRQSSFYKTALEDNLLFAVQKPNDIGLHKDIYAAIISFFKGEYNNGGLERSIPFETACEVINDKTVNPSSQDRKIHNVSINWIPTENTESLVIRVNRNDGVLIAEGN